MKLIRPLLLVSLAIALLAPTAHAQYFGRNKVQWEKFDFRVLRTDHFDIYYYPEEEPVVQDIGRMAERWYERLSRVFGHQFDRKPIVLYANHPDFQQTTTTRGLIGEGTGGFTDAFINRVVLPLTPVNADNDHVLGHEMVHVFQFDIAARAAQSPGRRFNLQQLPLWIIEGLAEYFSQGRTDPQTAMWLRDAAINNRLPDLKKLTRDPRLSPYQFGQAFWAYIGGRWGDDNVTRLFLASAIVGVEDAFPRVLSATAKEVFEGWHASVREAYDPVIAARWKPQQVGPPIVGQRGRGRNMDVSPVITPDGRRIAFLSTRDLFSIGLFVADVATGRVERLVSEDSDPHFDALRFIDSAGSWSPDGRRLAFVVVERGDNRLAIVNADSGEIERRIAIPGIDALSNPAWSPDGRQIAFSGQNNGVSDLYVYDLESGAVRQVTNDRYSDLQPAWSPDGRTLAFVTDRGAETDLALLEFQNLRLALTDAAGGRIQLLDIFPATRHISPQFSPDGEALYFIANPEGISDVFRFSIKGGAVARVTNVATGVAGITDTSPALSVASRSGEIVFSLFNNGRYSIHRVQPQAMAGQLVAREGGPGRAGLLPPVDAGGRETVVSYLDAPTAGLPPKNVRFHTRPYDQSLRLTYLGPPTVGVGVDRYGLGLGGSITALWSDILGQHEVGTSIVSGSGGSSFASSIAGQVYYLNQEQRVQWGAAALHVPYISSFTTGRTEVINIDGQNVLADVIEQERQIQTIDELSVLSRYPLGLTRRFEANAGYTRFGFDSELERVIVVGNQIIDRDTFDIDSAPDINLFRGALAFVGDSSFFGFVSPVKGTRYRFELETYTGDLGFQTALADYRKYFFARPVTFAVRGLHYGRYGSDSEDPRLTRLSIGRSTLVRGYELDDIGLAECVRTDEQSDACPVFDRLVGSKIAVASAEVRLPLVGTEEFGLIRGEFLPVELVGFVDGGVAWTEDEEPRLKFEEDTTERVPVFSAGISARILLGGYLPIELYYAFPFQRPNEDAVFGFSIAPGW